MIRRLLVSIGLVLALASFARAQEVSVSGTVVDSSGARVPGASVTLTGPGVRELETTAATGEYQFANLPAGTYDISVLLVGFAPATQTGISATQGNVTVPPITLALANVGETVIVSASRTEGELVDAAATMSVLPASTLEALPSSSFADVLRTVPGTNVIQLSARDINVTSRQGTSTLATSQLTLVDGRSVYLDFFGLVLWDMVPTNPADIKQIEVVRGPASAVWGANALTGVVNIITKSPRETPGATTLSFSAGTFDRDAGSTVGRGAGNTFGAAVTTSQVASDRWSYRVSAGYFNSDPFPRPAGLIPLVADPRDPSGRTRVGGAAYPADAVGPLGTAFQNKGTSQPKFDARVDQELTNGRVTYSGGVAGSEGVIFTGIGPFDIQPGSVMGYGRVSYARGAFKFNVFTNIVDADAPNLLVPNPLTGGPLQLNFKTQTYDVEASHATPAGTRQVFTYGGNFRRNNFDITLTPAARDRNEVGAYVQDEIFAGPFRFWVGARVDKYGNIDDPVFSPRLTAAYRLTPSHSVRFGFNRAFRSPSTVNNYLDIALVNPIDLRALAPLLPPPLQPAVAAPFPLVVRAVGSELAIGGQPQDTLKEESLTAYEVAYTGTIGTRTTLGAAYYINELDQNINFVQLPNNLDPYTPANPPPGWQLPPVILGQMAQLGIFLPRTAFTYLNLGPLRQKGLELSLDQRVSGDLNVFTNYSWQGEPDVVDDPNPYPAIELALPPTHRFNVGGTYNGPRFLGSLTASYTDEAFWSDVLTSAYHGFTDSFTLVNGSFGVKWADGKVVTLIKSTNIANTDIQQHVFGDILKRSIVGEVQLHLSR